MKPLGEGTYKQLRDARRADRSRVIFIFLAIIAVVGWAYVIFVSDLFVVREVRADGLRTLDPLDVEREAFLIMDERGGWRPWSPRHEWFIDRQHLENELNARLFAEKVTVDNISSNVLRLKIEERSKKFIFQSHQQYVWVDLQGVVTDKLTDDERKDAQLRILGSRIPTADEPPLIHIDLDELVATGYVVADAQHVRRWVQAAYEIVKAGVPYRAFEPPRAATSTEAVLEAPEGYPVILDIGEPLEPQLKSYLAFKSSPPADLKVTQYVDARIPGRVYVK